MGGDCYFSGSSLVAVDARGRLTLPAFVLQTLRRRSDSDALLLRAHETDPCLTGHDAAYGSAVAEELHRLKLIDEQKGVPAAAHHARARRLFAFGEETRCNGKGRIELPPLMRRRALIGERALVIGTGGTFEIWDPGIARDERGFGLGDLAQWWLEQSPRGRPHPSITAL